MTVYQTGPPSPGCGCRCRRRAQWCLMGPDTQRRSAAILLSLSLALGACSDEAIDNVETDQELVNRVSITIADLDYGWRVAPDDDSDQAVDETSGEDCGTAGAPRSDTATTTATYIHDETEREVSIAVTSFASASDATEEIDQLDVWWRDCAAGWLREGGWTVEGFGRAATGARGDDVIAWQGRADAEVGFLICEVRVIRSGRVVTESSACTFEANQPLVEDLAQLMAERLAIR